MEPKLSINLKKVHPIKKEKNELGDSLGLTLAVQSPYSHCCSHGSVRTVVVKPTLGLEFLQLPQSQVYLFGLFLVVYTML